MLALHRRLVNSGKAAAEVALVEPVMRCVRQAQNEPERNTLMSRLLRNRWSFGIGTLATAAACIVLIVTLSAPNVQAKATEVMARGAKAIAKIKSIHLRGQLRTLPADNFSYIDANRSFCSIELWKQFEPELKWRVEKPGRVAVMDGQQTILYVKPANQGMKIPQRSASAFDTEWLQRIANLSATISNELRQAQAKGWKLGLTEERAADGKVKSVVTVEAKSGLPETDFLKNVFFDNADTRRVYRFDAESERLEAVQIYINRGSNEVQLFELSQIDYDQTIDANIWQLDLPADVSWYKEPQKLQKLPDNEKYASMSAEQAARTFFDACARRDWTEAEKLMSPLTDRVKEYLGGLEVISLSNAFKSQAYPGQFVPYEVKLQAQEFNLRLSNANSAKRYVITAVFDRNLRLRQDLPWSPGPEALPNNDAYAKLSPAEAVKAYVAAQSKFNWDEMKKFAPASDVENDRLQIEEAQKGGMDARNMMPEIEVGEATWSAEQSCYFVKCHMTAVKKWNLALRKDNPAGRWQVDGGF